MNTNTAGTDRDLLTQHAYASDDKLNIRYEIHEKYTVPRLNFKAWVLDCITWRGNERVLDLGAGPGSYFGAVKARIPWGEHFAGDLSFGMVQRQQENSAGAGSHLANMDAQNLPYASNSFDVVLANHMLYHVPDIDRALAEIKRVLRPNGVLVAATNSVNNMPELNTLYRRAILLLTGFKHQSTAPLSMADRFAMENASQIAGRHFYAVARYDLPSALIFPEAEPVVAYLSSMRDLREPNLPDGIMWDEFMGVMRQQVERLIAYSGKMVVKKLAGVVVATDRGGFIEEYARQLHANPRA